ncbi:MAG: cytochrome-c peroxidase [Planctomycetota bacterium]
MSSRLRLRPPDAAALVTLGEALFFDKELSGNRNMSCATCHHPDVATGDGLPLSLGEGAVGRGPARAVTANGQVIARNAPHVFNAGLPQVPSMFWDGRVRFNAATGVYQTPEPGLNGNTPTLSAIVAALDGPLAAQALFPVTSPEEMRGDPGSNELADAGTNAEVWSRIMARLVGTSNGTVGGILGYRNLFQAAFPAVSNFDDLNFGHAARAIAAYERASFTFLNTPLDRYLAGDLTASPTPPSAAGWCSSAPGAATAATAAPCSATSSSTPWPRPSSARARTRGTTSAAS